MTTPRIPKGWRKLRKGEVIRKSDKISYERDQRVWESCDIDWLKGEPFQDACPVIRRIRPSRKPANKKQGKQPTPFQELNGLKERFLARGDYYHAALIRDVIKQSREGGLLREFAK